ncbi:MSC_0622 family F1-like ATPase gamma subunit [Metamycoplasma buccale]|uniref:MSC_0622 family F1-like ATPase gamma subunit n=1 Tax=Metamycoplasma buccale TaxID=55602 RepID=UPI00398F5A5E
MHLKDLERKKTNLDNVRTKLNNDKNILLINIMKLTKKMSFYIENAILNKNLISSINTKYDLNNSLIEFDNKFLENEKISKIKNLFTKDKQLWVYVTEVQKYSTDSYSRYEKKILSMTKKAHADFIAIGDKALEFCKKNKFNILLNISEKDRDDELASSLVQIVKALYTELNYKKVFFVINTNKSYDEPFQILPLKSFNLEKLVNIDETKNIIDITDFKIYPDIEKFIDAQINIFLENSIHSLIIESSFYNAKNNLVINNKANKKLNEEITKVNKKLQMAKRELEVEEIVMLTRKNKTILDNGEAKNE